jgi:hypothetical protein
MKIQKKLTNVQASEFDFSIGITLSVVTISKPQKNVANQQACSSFFLGTGVQATYTMYNVLAYLYDQYLMICY